MSRAGALVRTYADETLSDLRCDPTNTTIQFRRDAAAFTIDLAGTITPVAAPPVSRTLFANGRELATLDISALRVASRTGDVLLGERDGHVIAVERGTPRVIAPGQRPFPSLDGKTVYFRAADNPRQLRAVALAGGPVREVATLGGRIVIGTDGPDGQHVMIEEDDHHLVSIRIGRGELTDEGAHWVVPAPTGEWRYWQKPGPRFELRVIAPGKALGSMDCVFDTDTRNNPWIDEHHVAYGLGTAWNILDVRTCTDETPRITVIETGAPISREAVIAPDGVHWFAVSSPR
jgi:hypothetical protein